MKRAARRSLNALAAALALSLLPGCILQTDAPLMDDASASLLLGSGAVKLDFFQADAAHPGQWLPADAPHLTVQARNGHYVVPDPDHPSDPAKSFNLWLLPLDAGHAAVQVADPSGLLYGLATWDGKTLDLAMLNCKSLAGQPGIDDLLTFDGDDCHPKADHSGAKALFIALLPLMPKPGLRAILAP